ncbi:family with sequence similarity 179, member [Nesidiocoris tenuis]|uniref:Family with sequence similarity 179, member n=1 Tax=Nesidiocoris tenuis TaxID=355587 RepID=A0ABN7AUE4_9HEMI|nr:family with sequence similarity 179, member [Nesidiocoris tenuis]
MWFKCCSGNSAVAPTSPSSTIRATVESDNNNSSWGEIIKDKLPSWFPKKDKVVDDKLSLSDSITLIKLPSPTESRSSYNGVKENGFIRSPVINSDASRSEPSLVGRSPHSSPARTRSSHSPSLGSAKSVENGLTASSPSLAAIRNADDADGLNQRGCSSRLGTPGPGSVNSSLISILSQPHLENESIDRGDGRSSRATRRGEDVGEAVGSESGAVTPLVSTSTDRQGAASPPPNPPPNENSAGHSHQTGTPNEPSVGTPSSDMSESSRNTEMTAKSMESLKGVNEEAKPRRRIPQRADAKNRSLRARGFEVKSSENSSLYPQSLQPFDNPRDAITKAVMQLENPEWEVIIQGLQTVVRLVRHHTKDIQGGVTHSFVVPLTKHIKNLRSQVSRGACQCARELFMTLGKHMDSEVEDLAGPLLSRMADTNKFLRGDSCGALEAMVDHASPSKSVASLVSKGAKHQNAVVRGATCRLLLRLCNRLGPEKTLALPKDTRDAILLTGAKFLTEGSLETRKYAKEMFSTLSASHRLNGILADVIPHNIMRNIQKVLTRITA